MFLYEIMADFKISILNLHKGKELFWQKYGAKLLYDNNVILVIVNRCVELDIGPVHERSIKFKPLAYS